MPTDKAGGGPSLVCVLLSFVLGMVLRIIPIPAAWFPANPDWLALLLVYWTLNAPERVGVVTAWLLGLIADVLTGRLLGQYALAYTVIAYLNLRVRLSLQSLPMPAQSLWVLVLLLLGEGLVLWTQRIELAESVRLIYWLPTLTGALAWPLVVLAMRGGDRATRRS
jgi:rod shape-determining protein MreD